MCLDVLLEVLRALEGLSALSASVRLEGNMHAHVRGYVIALDDSGVAVAPAAGEVEVIRILAPDVKVANVILSHPFSASSFPSCYGG